MEVLIPRCELGDSYCCTYQQPITLPEIIMGIDNWVYSPSSSLMPSAPHYPDERLFCPPRSPAYLHADGPCLTGLHRLSICCHAPLMHIFPLGCRYLDNSLEMACTQCGERIDADSDFEVVNELGEVIWPRP